VRAETLERLLAGTSSGLSATAIAEQTGAGYNRTLKLLRDLEAAGQVRRSGSRRTTVWRLITDEDRILERAAELERRRSAPSQRAAGPGPRSVAGREPRRLGTTPLAQSQCGCAAHRQPDPRDRHSPLRSPPGLAGQNSESGRPGRPVSRDPLPRNAMARSAEAGRSLRPEGSAEAVEKQ